MGHVHLPVAKSLGSLVLKRARGSTAWKPEQFLLCWALSLAGKPSSVGRSAEREAERATFLGPSIVRAPDWVTCEVQAGLELDEAQGRKKGVPSGRGWGGGGPQRLWDPPEVSLIELGWASQGMSVSPTWRGGKEGH